MKNKKCKTQEPTYLVLKNQRKHSIPFSYYKYHAAYWQTYIKKAMFLRTSLSFPINKFLLSTEMLSLAE